MKRITHSLLAFTTAFALLGCTDPAVEEPAEEMTEHDNHDAEETMGHEAEEGHVHKAPHGGHMITLGNDEYDLEVVYPDPKDGSLMLYLLGDHGMTPVMVTPESIVFELDGEGGEETVVPVTAVGGMDGEASQFTAPAESLGGAKDIEDLEAHVHVTVGDKKYDGELEHDHDGEGVTGETVEEVPVK